MKGTLRQIYKSGMICSILICMILGDLQAQGISVGDGFHYNSTVFQMHSTSQGLLIPRLTAAQIEDIGSPSDGLQVYSLTDDIVLYFDGTSWLPEYAAVQRSEYEAFPSDYIWIGLDSFPGADRVRSDDIYDQ